jgi:hypothetical protein
MGKVERFWSYAFSSGVVRPPRFEPGSPAWEASVLTKLDYGRACELIQRTNKNKAFPHHTAENLSNPIRQVTHARKLKSGYGQQFLT